jgi:hypothetical protein
VDELALDPLSGNAVLNGMPVYRTGALTNYEGRLCRRNRALGRPPDIGAARFSAVVCAARRPRQPGVTAQAVPARSGTM